MANFQRNTKILELMEKIQLVIDGEPAQDCANALQYVLNIVHNGPGQSPPIGGMIPGVQRGPDSSEESING